MKSKLKPWTLSFIVSLIISILFLVIIFGIFYAYVNNSQPAKDALNTLGSFFGGMTTLAAALIASLLFNDWRDQHNKNIEAQFAKEVMDLTCKSNFQLLQALNAIESYIQNIDDTSPDNFKTAFQNLNEVRDTLLGIICPKVHIIVAKEDYSKHFFPVIKQLTDKLEIYIESLHKCIKGGIYKNDPSYKTYFNETCINTKDLKEQFDLLFLMLKPYIKVHTQD